MTKVAVVLSLLLVSIPVLGAEEVRPAAAGPEAVASGASGSLLLPAGAAFLGGCAATNATSRDLAGGSAIRALAGGNAAVAFTPVRPAEPVAVDPRPPLVDICCKCLDVICCPAEGTCVLCNGLCVCCNP